MKTPSIKFAKKASPANLVAAAEFLSITTYENNTKSLVKRLAETEPKSYYARDILRAAGLPTLSNEKVASQLFAMSSGDKLSPILVVKGWNGVAIVADGYHRLSAAHLLSEHARVKAIVVDW